jgi:hypothetical protein
MNYLGHILGGLVVGCLVYGLEKLTWGDSPDSLLNAMGCGVFGMVSGAIVSYVQQRNRS